ncbi:hypothetical protein SAY87_032166 [Trapa incisa]|uniref:Pentatricopeptide repeat-containing protein n=1 Tax=Trapa incisa TaxID=236973 RepID=A0AAN7QLR8_9MYRT|nr:hypothetical protein SAY87_032166 [Trapa incisa]
MMNYFSRNGSLCVGITRPCSVKNELLNGYVEDNTCVVESHMSVSCGSPYFKRFYHQSNAFPRFSITKCGFSSQAGAKSSGEEDDLQDGFSELETPLGSDTTTESNLDDEKADESASDADVSDVDGDEESPEDELEILTDKGKGRSIRAQSQLFQAIISARSVENALDKWVEDGKDLNKDEIWLATNNLRRRRMFGRALQLSEWLETRGKIDFVERDYASRVDLIAKLRGLHRAETYIEKIPESLRGEIVHRTFLANCVAAGNVKKAEETFNKMRDLEFPTTAFTCNQLLLLYKRLDKKKIADVLLLMEKENVKPTGFTYRLLIDSKGQSNDLDGMDQIVEAMKAEGVELDISTQAVLAKHYAADGQKMKAESILRDMEGGDLMEHRSACPLLLPLYAELGKVDEVRRIWEVCERSPRANECVAAIEAWGRLKKIDEAEAVFNGMVKRWKKLSATQFSAMLKVYANNKMLTKGKDMVKQMADSGCKISPLTWDIIVKLYVESGEVERADSILHKATQQNLMRPMYSTFMSIMSQYSKRGDVHNAEKLFHRMRLSGYTARITQFQSLLQAYINAKTSAYGMRDRMKADNLFPNKAVAALLARVDPFKKTPVSELLD